MAEKAVSSARVAEAEVYCKIELHHALSVYNSARQSFAARRFDRAKTYSVLAKEWADSTAVLATRRKAHVQADADNAIQYCENKMAVLQNIISRAETMGIAAQRVNTASVRFSELERQLLEMLDKNREGKYHEVIELSDRLAESVSLATYEMIKLISETRKTIGTGVSLISAGAE